LPSQEILISRSAFPHRIINISYINAFGLLMGRDSQADHIVIKRTRLSSVTGVLPVTGNGCESDHCLMVAEVRSANEKIDVFYGNI
jgi:hypothetical protein